MIEVMELYKEYQDLEYAKFQAKLAPTLDPNTCLGVRIPNIRKIAIQIKGSDIEKIFLNELPHKYYDDNMLHSVILSKINNYDEAINLVEKFLPYVDNWATCDTMHPKGLAKNKVDLFNHIKIWIKSKHTYTVRFAIDCLMTYFLDDDFSPSYLELVSKVTSDEYYINMMIAWYFATALVKKHDDTIKYLKEKKLSTWVHNKTIQKAIESFRIDENEKEYLRSLKI